MYRLTITIYLKGDKKEVETTMFLENDYKDAINEYFKVRRFYNKDNRFKILSFNYANINYIACNIFHDEQTNDIIKIELKGF